MFYLLDVRMTKYQSMLIPLIITTIMVALQLSPTQSLLRFQSDLMITGEVWRLITGNFIHLGWVHLLLNLLGLWLVWLIGYSLISVWRWIAVIIVSCLGCSVGLLFFSPEINWYVGFSGVLHGLIVVLSFGFIRRGMLVGWMLLVLLCCKLLFEQLNFSLGVIAENIGGDVIVDAHLYGAISGIAISLFFASTQHDR
jgi:rhomboid family GlyGly-CTERM serine protease